MEFGIKVFALLAFAVNLAFCQIDCEGNMYQNKPLLIFDLSGFLYTISSSVFYANNELFYFDQRLPSRSIFSRTTNDDGCCKSFDIKTKLVQSSRGERGGYFPYQIKTDPNCGTKLDEPAHLKLLASNTAQDGTFCISLWTCRASREGHHVFCNKRKVSAKQQKWISEQFEKYGQKEIKIQQTVDYRNGGCFTNAKRWDNKLY